MARILLIEDDPPTLALWTEALEMDGHEIRASYDLEALLWAREGWPEVIVLDLMLPYLSGSAMLAYLHHTDITRRIPVIVASAITKTARPAATLGARMVLQKPVALDVVEAAIAHVLKGTTA